MAKELLAVIVLLVLGCDTNAVLKCFYGMMFLVA